MSTSTSQDKDFLANVISATLLEDAIGWIAKNLNPEDVFSEGDLEGWAEKNDYVKEE